MVSPSSLFRDRIFPDDVRVTVRLGRFSQLRAADWHRPKTARRAKHLLRLCRSTLESALRRSQASRPPGRGRGDPYPRSQAGGPAAGGLIRSPAPLEIPPCPALRLLKSTGSRPGERVQLGSTRRRGDAGVSPEISSSLVRRAARRTIQTDGLGVNGTRELRDQSCLCPRSDLPGSLVVLAPAWPS